MNFPKDCRWTYQWKVFETDPRWERSKKTFATIKDAADHAGRFSLACADYIGRAPILQLVPVVQ